MTGGVAADDDGCSSWAKEPVSVYDAKAAGVCDDEGEEQDKHQNGERNITPLLDGDRGFVVVATAGAVLHAHVGSGIRAQHECGAPLHHCSMCHFDY